MSQLTTFNITLSTQNGNHTIETRDGFLYVNGVKIEDPERAGGQTDIFGTTRWTSSEGKLHRDYDLPAVIHKNGSKQWYQYNKLHRDGDKPASILEGNQFWYQDGKQHRDNDKPAVIRKNGDKSWWQHDKKHRDGDKPAIILYKDGKIVYTAFYLDGKMISELGESPY